jgi:hypothetical protein
MSDSAVAIASECTWQNSASLPKCCNCEVQDQICSCTKNEQRSNKQSGSHTSTGHGVVAQRDDAREDMGRGGGSKSNSGKV